MPQKQTLPPEGRIAQPTHAERGRFAKGNRVGGRTVGAKDKFFSRRGVGSLRRAYQEFIEQRDGHRKMVDALEAGIKNPKTALGFMELGAKVLDKTEEIAGRVVHFHIHTNVDPFKLRAAGAPHGLVGRPAPQAGSRQPGRRMSFSLPIPCEAVTPDHPGRLQQRSGRRLERERDPEIASRLPEAYAAEGGAMDGQDTINLLRAALADGSAVAHPIVRLRGQRGLRS